MSTMTAFEANTRFGELLERVARGEEIVITKPDKPVARIIPERRTSLERAVDDVFALRRQMKQRGVKPLSNREIVDAIQEGRPLARLK